MKQTERKKVLFYSNIPGYFRSTLIWYLYEISQAYTTVLLSEKLDEKSEKLIRNKELFPHLVEIIPVHQHTGQKRNFFFSAQILL